MTQDKMPDEIIINKYLGTVVDNFPTTITPDCRVIKSDRYERYTRTDLYTALTQAQGVDKWQPIDTAPKDGTPIIVGCFDDANQWCGSTMWIDGYWLNYKRCKTLTHWMPLTPPKE